MHQHPIHAPCFYFQYPRKIRGTLKAPTKRTDKANNTLLEQLKGLNKWTIQAEDIRQAAEDKAKEAYDKLKVNEKLDENVQKIVKANEAIKDVHEKLGGHLSSLGAWNAEASKVLAGAIEKATEVHDALDVYNSGKGQLKTQIGNIETYNKAIKEANEQLEKEVQNLGKWNTAAKDVIGKADGKCNTILDKVKTEDSAGKDTIFEQAELLHEKGKELLDSAIKAKDAVESKVTKALEAVVEMDTSLKKDLKKVKEGIKIGIDHVIKTLQVNELDEKVKNDLESLRGKIEGLGKDVESNGLVKAQLEKLAEEKKNLETVTGKTTGTIDKEMGQLESKFNTYIKTPLNLQVTEVDTAIGTLGGKFELSGGSEKKLEEIFKQIKGKLGEIKGEAGMFAPNGTWESNNMGSGLDGIKSKVHNYAQAFSGDRFADIVKGWLEATILRYNGTVRRILNMKQEFDETRKDGNIEDFAIGMKEKLKTDVIGIATDAFQNVNIVSGSITENIKAVQQLCNGLANALDEELYSGTKQTVKRVKDVALQKGQLVAKIQSCICECDNCNKQDCGKKAAAELILCALTSTARQVGNELNSVFLSPDGANIASILDKITPIAKELDDKLHNSLPPPGQKESPAKAVDSKLEAVRNMVEKDKLITTFKSEVTKELTEAVKGLPNAVETFNSTAEEQIKAAARTAITKAAEQISKNGAAIVLGDNLMNEFHTTHEQITKNLEDTLKQRVDDHIGDDQPGGQGVQPKKFILVKQHFGSYDSHVKQDKIKALNGSGTLQGTSDEGHLPKAIGDIRTLGLEALEETIGVTAKEPDKIDDNTFTTPAWLITQELEGIAQLVNTKNSSLGQQQGDEGIQQHLQKLKEALDQKGFNDADNQGLEAIETAINTLQTETYGPKSSAIEGAVDQIRGELKKLREKLKKEQNGGTKDGVIDVLDDLKTAGVEGKNGWKGTQGLTKIQQGIQEQNTELGKQPEIITNAISAIRDQLFQLGIKLNKPFDYDDVLDKLIQLQRKLGTADAQNYGVNLKKIYDEIHWQQISTFTHKPYEIQAANSAIKAELKAQMSTLDNDVITTLNDLMTNGLSNQASWKPSGQEAAKGFDHIISELNTQQSTLEQQPTAIGSGVTQITNEIDELRSELQGKDDTEPKEKGVINNLKHLEEKIGEGKNEGLEKIKKDIEELNRDTVPKVNEHLGELCAKIASEAGSVDWQLGLFKENNIDKDLAKIKTQIDTLRTGDLHKAIEACDKFLTNADYIKWEKVENIERFVDSEIEKAIAELTKQARRDYVASAKDALKHFAARVADALQGLPEEIAADLAIGYKGFMAKMQDDFVKNIQENDFTQDSPPLTQVAERLGDAARAFFPQLLRQADMFRGIFPRALMTDEQIRQLEAAKRRNDHDAIARIYKALPQGECEETSADKFPPNLAAVTALMESFDALVQHIEAVGHFDHAVMGQLCALQRQLDAFHPEPYGEAGNLFLLLAVKKGLIAFPQELKKAYVSRYSGQAPVEADADRYAKVFLTVVPIMFDTLTQLRRNCRTGGRWRDYKINMTNQLGQFLHRCGYSVSSPADQDGELRRDDECHGAHVHNHLGDGTYYLVREEDEAEKRNDHHSLLRRLTDHLHHYYRCCHLKTHPAPRPPCSVYEMLTWVCGLKHNPVYQALTAEALPSLFQTDDMPPAGDSLLPVTELGALALPAHPQHITLTSLTDALTEVCHKAHSVLTTLLGFGHAKGIYAVDFNTNPGGLLYPRDTDTLLCLLFDVIKRLHHQLYFLYRRCLYNARHGGWLDCWYGRGVGGSAWRCNTMQCANQMCDQQCNQICNQICNQTCDQHPKCGVKSPLQSFLEDGLVGFLPHAVTPKDTCVKCSACDTKSPGLPCKTPMGFAHITRLASRASTGRRLMDALGKFCGGASAPLTRLCAQLNCLLTRPPRTPADLFAFLFNLPRDWPSSTEHRKAVFEEAVASACFRRRGVSLDVTQLFRTSQHGTDQNMPHLTGDLFALVSCNATPRSTAAHPCGPFLKPICHDVRATFAREYAHLYLSWVVYLTETFYDLLKQLLQDCERNCADVTSNCHARSCAHDCSAKQRPMAQGSNHLPSCPSIADCDHSTPTLFRYGFVLRDVHSLAGSTHGLHAKRTCEDLCITLQAAVRQMNPLHKLAHDTIPEFLFHIRLPFLLTLAALWLTALAYILVSLLYRMDVLRIRSHLLTTRASHLIDVKALLAGSRRMLSLYKDVDYFDDDFHSLLHPSFQWIEAADAAIKAAKVKAENVHDNLDHSDNNGDPKTPIGQGVKQIKDAKGKVSQVDGQLKRIHSDLGNWKDAASGVLETAVSKAGDVREKLDPNQKDDMHPIGHNIDKIHTSNEAIKEANSQLKSQVDSLSNWIDTAEEIRQKAQQKAEEAYKS
ncbi:hypothetical protein, conserved [Babesia ovata]|uniref:Extracellular matrix-binding ebh n=1 Tax=Babesia ovata TaxID=189622 RepID=A0A2H6KJV3_9APIC|nr:uncharacterized protein BOVATA_047670 [Babesia ovata]GBE63274.1 hypothetical protein, conserved [Babesia ovata]